MLHIRKEGGKKKREMKRGEEPQPFLQPPPREKFGGVAVPPS